MYLEPWHFDVFDFLELKKNTGKEEQRARDLFYALWIPDLFMKRVESNAVSIVWIKYKYSKAQSPKTHVWIASYVGLVSDVPQWLSRPGWVLGRGVRKAIHKVWKSCDVIVKLNNICWDLNTFDWLQVWAGGQSKACGKGSAGMVRHHWVSDGNRYALYALQGRLQP